MSFPWSFGVAKADVEADVEGSEVTPRISLTWAVDFEAIDLAAIALAR